MGVVTNYNSVSYGAEYVEHSVRGEFRCTWSIKGSELALHFQRSSLISSMA